MKGLSEQLRNTAKELLREKKVDFVIGYAPGSVNVKTTPYFAFTPEEAENLVWNPLCANILVTYLLDYRYEDVKVAVAVKGCDARAINRLIHDRQLKRDKVVVIGLPCRGILDADKIAAKIDPRATITDFEYAGDNIIVKTDKGDVTFNRKEYLLHKCLVCEDHNPIVADIVIGEQVEGIPAEDNFAEVKQLEALSPAERDAYWEKQFSRCIRCYACRNICPACNCKECCFDQAEPQWLGKANNSAENHVFHLTRAMHVAGRCIDCGECDRICPMDIPLRKLNKKILKDMKELFGIDTPGKKTEDDNPIGSYRLDDPDEFNY